LQQSVQRSGGDAHGWQGLETDKAKEFTESGLAAAFGGRCYRQVGQRIELLIQVRGDAPQGQDQRQARIQGQKSRKQSLKLT
jgi:hypothetical protein